jgi:hypothetical protein
MWADVILSRDVTGSVFTENVAVCFLFRALWALVTSLSGIKNIEISIDSARDVSSNACTHTSMRSVSL